MSWHYEYGWVSHFDNGEKFDEDEGYSRSEVEQTVKYFNAEEKAEAESDPDYEPLTFTIRRRKVQDVGPWETFSDIEEEL